MAPGPYIVYAIVELAKAVNILQLVLFLNKAGRGKTALHCLFSAGKLFV